MPQIFKVAGYLVFFWANEGEPSEPIHVHIIRGTPSGNSTKVWITKSGHCLLCNNNSQIPERVLRNIMDVIETRSLDIVNKWYDYFREIKYFC